MYFPQIRSVGQHTEARCIVLACTEHSQRENLHILVVLVPHAGHFVDVRPHLLGHGCHFAANTRINHQTTIPRRFYQWSGNLDQQYSGKKWSQIAIELIEFPNALCLVTLSGWWFPVATFARSEYQCECVHRSTEWPVQTYGRSSFNTIGTIVHGNGTVLSVRREWKGNDDLTRHRNAMRPDKWLKWFCRRNLRFAGDVSINQF